MTIYDAPVSDTEFFPVSGDMLRLMKHEEQQAEIRRRDNAIRQNMPKHRAEHLIRALNENDPGASAKNTTGTADLNNYQEEQIMQDDTNTVSETPDVSYHPIWCSGQLCVTGNETTVHYSRPYVTERTESGDFPELTIAARPVQYWFDGDEHPQDIGVELEIDGCDYYLRRADLEDLQRSIVCLLDDLDFIGEA